MMEERGLFVSNPAAVAKNIVGAAWEQNPPLFEGRSCPKPHKASVAAYSLAIGICATRRRDDGPRETLCLTLATMMDEFHKNGAQYPFHHVDNMLIEKAAEVFNQAVTEEAERIKEDTWLP